MLAETASYKIFFLLRRAGVVLLSDLLVTRREKCNNSSWNPHSDAKKSSESYKLKINYSRCRNFQLVYVSSMHYFLNYFKIKHLPLSLRYLQPMFEELVEIYYHKIVNRKSKKSISYSLLFCILHSNSKHGKLQTL